jgi:hypothetical protein
VVPLWYANATSLNRALGHQRSGGSRARVSCIKITSLLLPHGLDLFTKKAKPLASSDSSSPPIQKPCNQNSQRVRTWRRLRRSMKRYWRINRRPELGPPNVQRWVDKVPSQTTNEQWLTSNAFLSQSLQDSPRLDFDRFTNGTPVQNPARVRALLTTFRANRF